MGLILGSHTLFFPINVTSKMILSYYYKFEVPSVKNRSNIAAMTMSCDPDHEV